MRADRAVCWTARGNACRVSPVSSRLGRASVVSSITQRPLDGDDYYYIYTVALLALMHCLIIARSINHKANGKCRKGILIHRAL